MQDPFIVESGALPASARVLGFQGTEGISKLYEIDLFVSVSGPAARAVELSDAVGTRLALAVDRPDAGPDYRFHGIISAFELVNEVATPGDERSVFRITVVPQLWLLGHSFHSRVFTRQSIPEIIAAVLVDNGISESDFELRLSNAYATEEHVSQYKETDLAFLSRWMEREGLYYFFEHEGREEKLVITDNLSAHTRFSPRALKHHPLGPGERPEMAPTDALHSIMRKQSAQPARVVLQDYDYLLPALLVTGQSVVSKTGLGDVSVYGDRFFTPADGQRLASIRAEAFRACADVISVAGTARDLRSGYLFEIIGHSRADIDGEYLVVEMEHVGRVGKGVPELDAVVEGDATVYAMKARAIPKSLQFRSARQTPWPRIFGFENAIVDGAATSQYAQIDDHGRYAIKLKFDEGPLRHGQASTWVRMAQPHGGSVEGFHFPLRKGTEVLVEFLDGDPDKPVIAGVLPTAVTPSPIAADNHTKNILRTGGNTQTEIEDLAGLQYMHTTTPVQNTAFWMGTDATSKKGHNVELSSGGSGAFSYGTYFDRFVGGIKTDVVKDDVARSYDSSYFTKVLGSVQQTFDSNQTHTVLGSVLKTILSSSGDTVVGPVKKTKSATLDLHVVDDVTRTYLANHSQKIAGTQDIHVTKTGTHTYQTGLKETVNGALSKHVANVSYKLEAKPDATMHATANFNIRGDVKAQISSPDTSILGDSSVTIDGVSKVEIKSKAVALDGSSLIRFASPDIQILGGDVQIKGGTVTFTGAKIDAKAGGPQMFTANGGLHISGGPMVDIKAGNILLNVNGPLSTGLGNAVDQLAAQSPTLQANLAALQKDGWTIKYGEPGKGTFCDRAKKIIVIDPNEKGNPEAVTQSLAHESGHALYKPDAYVPPDGLTRQQYIDANVNSSLKDEGEATLTNAQVRNEIQAASGTDIGIAGANSQQYGDIAAKYPNPADRDAARQEIANVFGTEHPSTSPGQTYTDYYGKGYADYWDQTHPPPSPP